MKLKEYAKLINDLAKDYPDIEVVYSADDEGNMFEPVHYAPTLGHYSGFNNYSDPGFISTDEIERYKPGAGINAVCIN